MHYTVVLLPRAHNDKRNIRTYLKQFYPGTSRRFFAALKKQLIYLADTPYMYPVWEGNPAYRKMGVLKYLVFYKVNDAERTIAIYRILHGSHDLSRHLS